MTGNGVETAAAGEAPARAASVVRLSDLVDGLEGDCFAALVKKVKGMTSRGQPFVKCYFRDKIATLEAPLWHDNRLHQQAESWAEGLAYRLTVRAELHPKFGMQLQIYDARLASEADEVNGYNFYDLVESTRFDASVLMQRIQGFLDKYIVNPPLKALVRRILDEHADLFRKMPAAQSFHHSFTGGLLEHVWSMTRVSGMLADHYSTYYHDLDPPLNKGVIVAAAVLHDIGKLRELAYHPVEAKYTTVGNLVGHVIMGRDLVHETAREVGGVNPETLMLLDHAILSHHGKMEFGDGAPQDAGGVDRLDGRRPGRQGQ